MVREHGELKPRVGVSSCLLGERVRYDGGHQAQPWSAEMGQRFKLVQVCPEMELGMGVPRETIQIETAADNDVALVGSKSRRDWTRQMRDWAARRVEALAADGLDGYIFKARSPSCGLGTTPVVGRAETRDGLFAEAIRARLPLLPVVDEAELATEAGRERFVRLVRAHRELRLLFRPGWRREDVWDFHTRRKLLLTACSPQAYAELARFVANPADLAADEFVGRYMAEFLRTLGEEPRPI